MRSVEQHLQYVSEDAASARSIPVWAGLMARVGAALAELDPNERRMVVGVTLPTRGFAAAISTAAHVLRRNQLDPIEPSDADLHFAVLRELPEGTPVKLMQGGRLHDGRLLGITLRQGTEFLKVSTRGMTRYLPKQVALNVRLSDGTRGNGDMRSRRIDVPPLLAAFVSGRQADAFATQSRVDCAVIGTLTTATADLTTPEFCVAECSGSQGCLQELARARGVPGAASGSRSLLVAAGADEDDIPEEEPRLVVFDGGRGYVRLGHRWTSSHHLVVIDRSVSSAEPAAAALNFAYCERVGEHDLGIGECPPSMELISFETHCA